ncbi:MAG: DUF2332 domain-containing protein [Methylobacteriaceae bacterium]|nr:DUF2332 domain-containing protein [Methylobacteriaceae bacterium]
MKISDRQDIVDAFERQARACVDLGGPFTGNLCRILGANLDDRSAFGRRVATWPADSLWPDLVPLRCCAALNTLVRRGRAPALAAFYPPNDPGDDEPFWRAIEATIAAQGADMTAFLGSPPQTNEVVRSAVLLGGFLTIAEAVGRPLALYELGASAGLNLLFDRYAYDLDDNRKWGDAKSPVRIGSVWKGRAPALTTPLKIASRAAVDLRPVDARVSDDRERMLAYIWPEQTERLRRIEPALDMVAASDLRVEQGDALAWLKTMMAGPPPDGACRVVFHSVFFQYLPADLRRALREKSSRSASARRPPRPSPGCRWRPAKIACPATCG